MTTDNTSPMQINLAPLGTQTVPTVNDQIMKLYLEAAPDDLLRADLIAEGIKTLEAAYVQGFRHGLAELKMRLASPSNIRS